MREQFSGLVGEVIAGRYELEELVGTGGMSSVFRAHDRLLERRVALKILHEQYSRDAEYVDRFRREARAAAQLNHPNIVTVIDRGEQDGRQFIVFEYVDGETLKELVAEHGPLPIRDAIELTLQVARALSFAHARGLVHRDVKPQNVILDGDGRAKVADFGIVRALEGEGATLTGTVLGTSDYMPPEQARGDKVDAQGDVYSLGAVLYELLTGEVPFPGESFFSVAVRHINDPAPSVLERRPETPLRLAQAVDCCLAKEPADRFGSMGELVAELEACIGELGEDRDDDATVIARPPPAPGRRPRRVRAAAAAPRRRRRLLLLPLLLVALAAGAVAAGLLWNGEPSSDGAAPRRPVRLEAVAAYDPIGADGEHRERVPDATDGDRATYWTTETYETFDKEGVGLVLDAGRETKVSRVTVVTDLPGATAEIRAGPTRIGRFVRVSESRILAGRTTFRLDDEADERYYLIWFTALAGDRAHVNEVKAS
jgi:eukaryotic-like serine/threonine-protein kinase